MKTTPAPAPFNTTDSAASDPAAADPTPTPEPSPPRGRPTGYSERVVEMLQEVIRKYGSSDSAAAERLGMAPSSLSRWKRKYPEVRCQLTMAREECRNFHLNLIINSALAEGGRGWRASAWLLERMFPEDFSPRAAERYQHGRMAREQAEREEREDERREVEEEQLRREEMSRQKEEARAKLERELMAMSPLELDAWFKRDAAAKTQESSCQNDRNAEPPRDDDGENASEDDCRNDQNPEEDGEDESTEDELEQEEQEQEVGGCEQAIASASDCRNCRNAEEEEEDLSRTVRVSCAPMKHNARRRTTSAAPGKAGL